MWPYGAVTTIGGIIAVRSLVFGSFFGLIGGKVAKSVFEKFSVAKSI